MAANTKNAGIHIQDDFPPMSGAGSNLPPYDDGSNLGANIEVTDDVSKVASNPGRNIALFILLAIALLGLSYFLFLRNKSPEKEPSKEEIQASEVPVSDAKPVTQEYEAPKYEIGVTDTPDAPSIQGLETVDTAQSSDVAPAPPSFPEPFLQSEPPLPPRPITEEPAESFLNLEEEPKPQESGELPPLPKEEAAPQALPSLPPTQQQQAALQGELPPPTINDSKKNADTDSRRKSDIMILNGGSGGGGLGGLFGGGGNSGGLLGSSSSGPSTISMTSSTQAVATYIGNTDTIIAQGKIIDAVLETAINTDLPGVLRAVVNRDIYAESGRMILVPRGSRLIGSYSSEIERGQKRVSVIWYRLIRPDGVDIAIDSPGIDQLGRSGVEGLVDNRYLEIFGNAVLLSTLTIGGAYALEKITDSGDVSSSSTTTSDGDTSTSESGTPTSLAISEAVTDLSDEAGSIAEGFLNAQPTITVAQGTRVKVFVNRDLVFPESVVQNTRFLQ